MNEFKVNDYITLLLVNNETIIYVNNKRFLEKKDYEQLLPVLEQILQYF